MGDKSGLCLWCGRWTERRAPDGLADCDRPECIENRGEDDLTDSPMCLGRARLNTILVDRIEGETRAIEQAERAGAIATAAMHDYGRRVLAEVRTAMGLRPSRPNPTIVEIDTSPGWMRAVVVLLWINVLLWGMYLALRVGGVVR